MKSIIIIFLILLNLQSFTKADDIRDFEIEGISIGDSLLNIFNEKEILDNIHDWYKDDEFKLTEFYKNKKFNEYDALKFHFKTNDQNYKTFQVSGINFYDDSIKNCYKDMKKIDKNISFLFSSLSRNVENQVHPADITGNSKTKAIRYWFPDGSLISIICYDWSEKLTKERQWTDNLTLEITTNEFNEWLRYKAYN